MAKLTGPLLSESAHGKLARILTYSKHRSSHIVRDYRIPRKDATLDQWTQRHIIGLLTAQWQCMTASEQLIWNVAAVKANLNMSGFNLFLKTAMTDLYTYHGLCGYWPMNEKTGAQVTDYSGQNHHGTLKPTYPTTCPTRVTAMRKEYGNALSFATDHNYVDLANLTGRSSLTLEGWFNSKNVTLESYIFMQATAAMGYSLGTIASKVLSHMNSGTWSAMRSTKTILSNIWYNVAMTYSNGVQILYINGIFDSQRNVTNVPPTNAARLGTYNTVDSFNGTADEVRQYNRALGAAEIKKHYELLRLSKERQPLLIH